MPYLLTTRYFDRVRWFKQAESEITAAHAQAVKNAERFKGSAGYKDLIERGDAERDTALNAEKATVREGNVPRRLSIGERSDILREKRGKTNGRNQSKVPILWE